MQSALMMEELVSKHSAIMDKYDKDKKIALFVDEWGGWYDVERYKSGFLYQQNTIRDAMIAGATLNIFNNHADRVKMANLAQAVNVLQSVILTKGDAMILTPTYFVMKMYKVHQNAKLIPLKFDSPVYEFNGESIPAISASCSQDDDGVVHLSLVNLDANKSHELNIDLDKLNFKNVSSEILSSGNISDFNDFENPNKIQIKKYTDFKVKHKELEIEIPPFSVVMVTLQ
ncbi:MAG: alpha-L-arabinofuranosidase C-terminal domain-containing protein [Saprospiraceae bacterium]